jgi:hypothetical protein
MSFIYRVFHTLMPNSILQVNYHIWALAYHLELVRLGLIKRLIINLAPRSLKSIVTSVGFPAFLLGHNPSKRVIVVSYGSDLAIKLSNDFRTVINEAWYQRLFPRRCFSLNAPRGFTIMRPNSSHFRMRVSMTKSTARLKLWPQIMQRSISTL